MHANGRNFVIVTFTLLAFSTAFGQNNTAEEKSAQSSTQSQPKVKSCPPTEDPHDQILCILGRAETRRILVELINERFNEVNQKLSTLSATQSSDEATRAYNNAVAVIQQSESENEAKLAQKLTETSQLIAGTREALSKQITESTTSIELTQENQAIEDAMRSGKATPGFFIENGQQEPGYPSDYPVGLIKGLVILADAKSKLEVAAQHDHGRDFSLRDADFYINNAKVYEGKHQYPKAFREYHKAYARVMSALEGKGQFGAKFKAFWAH